MNLFIGYFIIICAIINFLIKRSSNISAKKTESFWAKEQEANSTRRKNIDNLDYITIPLEKLPFLGETTPQITYYQSKIKELSAQKILNLNGISNTDLKLTYGAANIALLSQYDNNFYTLEQTLGNWAIELIQLNQKIDALRVLEVAVECGCSSRKIYENIIKLYNDFGISNHYDYLIEKLNNSNSPFKASLIDLIKSYQ